MSEDKNLTIRCPDCDAEIVIDPVSGAVLLHQSSKTEGPSKDFDALLADVDASKARADEVFQREVSALKDRDRVLDEKFREALRRAEEQPTDEPPVRPWDLD